MYLILLGILYLFDFIVILHSLPLIRGGLGWGIRVGNTRWRDPGLACHLWI